MPEKDLVLENWSAAVDAAREAIRAGGSNPPVAMPANKGAARPLHRTALKQRAEQAAKTVFDAAKAGVKAVRANITWAADKPPAVELEVVTMDRQRYPKAPSDQPLSSGAKTPNTPPLTVVLGEMQLGDTKEPA